MYCHKAERFAIERHILRKTNVLAIIVSKDGKDLSFRSAFSRLSIDCFKIVLFAYALNLGDNDVNRKNILLRTFPKALPCQ